MSFKADLKARREIHDFSRWYKCSEILGFQSLYWDVTYASYQSIFLNRLFAGNFAQHLPARICESCLARKDVKSPEAMNFRNFTPSAAWPATTIDHETFLAMGGHSDWECMEGWRLETTTFDFMHNVFLGGGRDLVASGIHLMLRQKVYGDVEPDNMDEVLGHVQTEMIRDCKKHGFLISNREFVVRWFFISVNKVSGNP